jgi:sugar transferase (PEP-CTERM system associated)
MVRIFSHYYALGTLYLVAVDAACLFVALLSGLAFVFVDGSQPLLHAVPGAVMGVALLLLPASLLGLYNNDAHEKFNESHDKLWPIGLRFSGPLLAGLVILHWLFYRSHDGSVSLQAIVTTLSMATMARLLVFSVGPAAPWFISRRVMILGVGSDAAMVYETLEKSRIPCLYFVGFYSPDADPTLTASLPAHKILMPTKTISETVRMLKVNEIIIATRERRGGTLPLAELLDCRLKGIKVIDLPAFYETYKSKVRIDFLRESWFIFGDGFRQGHARMFVKRAFDICASAVLLVLAMPIMLFAIIAIKLESAGPVIYRQDRIGLGGRPFKVLKFRSMRVDAEQDGRPQWAKAGDTRVTRVGRIMRLTRIDELPQLITVLLGHMSLVGPRPERQFFIDQIVQKVPFYAARHSVKPGVTGWAQVRHHYGASVDDAADKLEYDLFYVKNHTLLFDIVILFYSVRVVLLAQGSR